MDTNARLTLALRELADRCESGLLAGSAVKEVNHNLSTVRLDLDTDAGRLLYLLRFGPDQAPDEWPAITNKLPGTRG